MTDPVETAGTNPPEHADVFDALQALLVFAVDPVGLGLCVRGRHGPGRSAVLRAIKSLYLDTPFRKIPCHIDEDRLLGGLDLGATLAAGKPLVSQGVLASTHDGVAVLSMAERLPGRTITHLVHAMDTHRVRLERDGFSSILPARFAVVALDESGDDEPGLDPRLADRLALQFDADRLSPEAVDELPLTPADLLAARKGLRDVTMPKRVIEALCRTALGLGITSMRSAMQCVQAARVLAALGGETEVGDEQAGAAVRLVLAHRAVQLPIPEAEEESTEAPPDENKADDSNAESTEQKPLDDQLIDAAMAALPDGLLELLASGAHRERSAHVARTGAAVQGPRGRPIGDMPASRDARLNVLATLRTAAPWQKIRGADKRLAIRRSDFRTTRRKSSTQSVNIFVVDASGSSAAQRLSEVKGAVQLLLGDCYVRRDQVALIAFRGASPELLLAPTRSLVRAKRELANLPGGGATPLAGALDATRELARQVTKSGQRPVVILLTDGRGNVGRDGTPGHADSAQHTEAAAHELRAASVSTLLVDVAKRPRGRGRDLAVALNARYLALPYASSQSIVEAVQASGVAA